MNKSGTTIRALTCVSLFSLFSACGGGSSGTGNTGNEAFNAQLITPTCAPVPEAELSNLGISSNEERTGADGGFTLTPDAAGNVMISTQVGAASVDASGASCVLIQVENEEIQAVVSVPNESLPSCSVESVESEFPESLASVCPANSPG